MEIEKSANGTTLNAKVSGRIDTTTAPVFEQEIKSALDNITKLNIDFSELEYISSSGLRALLVLHNLMNGKPDGALIISHVNDVVNEVFEVTGFSEILTIV